MFEDLKEAIQAVRDSFNDDRAFKEKHLESFKKETLGTLSDANWQEIEDLVLLCLGHGQENVMKVATCMVEKRKLIDWKAHPEMVEKFLEKLLSFEGQETEEHNDSYYDFMEALVKQIKQAKLMKKHSDQLFKLMEVSVNDDANSRLQMAGLATCHSFPFEDNIPMAKQILEVLYTVVQESPELLRKNYRANVADSLIMRALFVGRGARPTEILGVVSNILTFCLDQEWDSPDDSSEHTLSYEFIDRIIGDYLMGNTQNKRVMKEATKALKELSQCGVERFESNSKSVLSSAGDNIEFDEDEVRETLDRFLETYDTSVFDQVSSMYDDSNDAFHERFDDLVEAVRNIEDTYVKMRIMQLFTTIASANPQVFTKEAIALVIEYCKEPTTGAVGSMVLKPLAEKRPGDLLDHDDELMQIMLEYPLQAYGIVEMIMGMAAESEDRVGKYLSFLAANVSHPSWDTNVQRHVIWRMGSIGASHIELLAQHKALFEEYKEQPALKEVCQNNIDAIEGRSLEAFQEDLEEQREDIDNLDKRVDDVEEDVDELREDVDQAQEDIEQAQEDIAQAEERLDNVEEAVEDVEEKVEEIDHKTLSHAPRWSRDVSKLLNPEDEHDWRLLASRLGYSADDIRNWATQADPCMSMLDEWFATHKTNEATHAVLKSLEEMDRTDAAEIVGRALASVEDIVDEEPPELTNPPPIFISYQWGHQNEAKLLKKHLGMAGYDAWMDIGQMGGGDKLFAKIDEGVRAAKVIICCVTEKYAKSPNCNREVNLSTTLGKPVIPLLMEQMQWPPPGSMGPIFGEYLFIRFFQRGDAESTDDDRYWPDPKFQELLMQLRYTIPPDESMLSEPYTGWWDPPEEIIVIKPRGDTAIKAGESAEANQEIMEGANSPDIFISYQWGKQPQIKALYKRLTSLGYSCWFDIMQMGGGDSLYDKIDKGVRGCHVMLSCVTTKYSKSANCRREVSLADAIKKPIIPLLLEEMAWPPEGPMGMVFTQLLYIGFSEPSVDIQNGWDCPEFDELLKQLQPHLPEVTGSEEEVNPTGVTASPGEDESDLDDEEPELDEDSAEYDGRYDEKGPTKETEPADQKSVDDEEPPNKTSGESDLEPDSDSEKEPNTAEESQSLASPIIKAEEEDPELHQTPTDDDPPSAVESQHVLSPAHQPEANTQPESPRHFSQRNHSQEHGHGESSNRTGKEAPVAQPQSSCCSIL